MDLSTHITTFTDFILRILLYAGLGFVAIALLMLLFGSLRFVHRFPVFSMLVALGLLVGIFYWLFPERTMALLINPSFYAPAAVAVVCLFLLSLLFRRRKERPAPSGKAFRHRYKKSAAYAYMDEDEIDEVDGYYEPEESYTAYTYTDPYEENEAYTGDSAQDRYEAYEDDDFANDAYEDEEPGYEQSKKASRPSSELAGLYRYFGLPQGAPFADVKKAYHAMQKEMHPDLYQDKPQWVIDLLNANIQEANANYLRLKKLLGA